MGFLDFLKKDHAKKQEDGLSFKQGAENIPQPPSGAGGAPAKQAPAKKAPMKSSGDIEGPLLQDDNAESVDDLIPTTPGDDAPQDPLKKTPGAIPKPPAAQKPQVEDPFADGLGAPVEESAPTGEEGFSTSTKEHSQEEDDDLSLPDLPDIPEDIKDADENEHESAKPSGEHATPKKESKTQSQEPGDGPKQSFFKAQEEAPKQDTIGYEPEEAGSEAYVDSFEFYEALQELKRAKKELGVLDKKTDAWDEVDEKIGSQQQKLLDTMDGVQEDLIKIDTMLFEG